MRIFKKLMEFFFKKPEEKKSIESKKQSKKIKLGYCLEDWNYFNKKTSIDMNISKERSSHLLIIGGNGSGKSYALQVIFARLVLAEPEGKFFFCDYKGDSAFRYLRELNGYRSYKSTLEALEYVFDCMNKRFSGEDKSTKQLTLILDEYQSFVASFSEKAKRDEVLKMISEIMTMGREKSIRLIICTQTAFAKSFPDGIRVNFDYIMILGAFYKTSYDMMFGEYDANIKNKKFNQGEGTVLVNGNELRFIKISSVANMDRMKEICKSGLK